MKRHLVSLALILCLISAASEASDIKSRLDFLESRLDSSRGSVSLWQDGWTAVYGMAAVTYVGLALDTDDSDKRTLHSVGALRAAVATALLTVRPHPGRRGADPVRALGEAPLAQRLAAAERLLEESAKRTMSKRRPARHLRNVLVNLGFGGLVWALGDKDDALPFTLMGIAGGEALLLSLPEAPRRDLQAYRSRFGSRSARAGSWRLIPHAGGVSLQFALPR